MSRFGARQVLAEMVKNGGQPRGLVDRLGLKQVSDLGALTPIVGQVMRQSGGKANPEVVSNLVRERLGS